MGKPIKPGTDNKPAGTYKEVVLAVAQYKILASSTSIRVTGCHQPANPATDGLNKNKICKVVKLPLSDFLFVSPFK